MPLCPAPLSRAPHAGLSRIRALAVAATATVLAGASMVSIATPAAHAQLADAPTPAPPAPAVPAPEAPAPATKPALESHTIPVEGQGEREYLLELPTNYDPSRAYPLVFGFGGWKHTAQQFHDYSHLSEVAGRDAILVYPEGINQAWEGPAYASTSRGQDVGFVRAIKADIAASHGIDSSRVYATGLSNGGEMALTLACQAPEMFAAVASVSGAAYLPTFEGCAGEVPTLMVHGTNDEIAPYYYASASAHGGHYLSAQQTWRAVGERNRCAVDQISQSRYSAAVDAFNFAGCTADTVLYRVNGGPHTWYAEEGSAAQMTWDFFTAHQRAL